LNQAAGRSYLAINIAPRQNQKVVLIKGQAAHCISFLRKFFSLFWYAPRRD
jgi:hypothetical protein